MIKKTKWEKFKEGALMGGVFVVGSILVITAIIALLVLGIAIGGSIGAIIALFISAMILCGLGNAFLD